jgi:hypothetical protein
MTRRWTPWAVIVEASKYETRSQFRKADSYAYTMAVKFGFLDSLFPRTNTLTAAIALALEVNDSAQLRKRYPAAARMLHRHGYYTTGVKHGKLFPENPEEEKYLSRGNSC